MVRYHAVVRLACAVVILAGAAEAAPQRQLTRRTIVITDDNANAVHELRVSEGTPTQVLFPVEVRESGVLLADLPGAFYPPRTTEKTLILVPKRDLPSGRVASLSVTLVDGLTIPFKLVTAKKETDVAVDVVVKLNERAPPQSSDALRGLANQLRAELDECQANTAAAGATKVAALILKQDFEKPQSFTVERHGIRRLDKQSRLLVEAKQVYRLFDFIYVVFTVENRDSDKTWVIERASVQYSSGSTLSDAGSVSLLSELTALPPGEIEKVIVSFSAPQQASKTTFNISLLEKSGSRHFRFEDLSL